MRLLTGVGKILTLMDPDNKRSMQAETLFAQIVSELKNSAVFFGHGVASAEEEALLLLSHVLTRNPDWINRNPQTPVDAEQAQRIRALLQRRLDQRVPMSYVTGTAWFAGLEFVADERALVPRSPFAELIGKGFQPWLGNDRPERVLDLCTGGGCIAIAMAKAFPAARVDAVDLSPEALSLAEINRDKHDLSDRLMLIQSDLFDAVTGRYDLIVSNPPYVSKDEYQQLPAEYRHEPGLGLVSDGQGLQIPLTILAQAADYLSEGGLLFLEVGHSDQALEAALPAVPLTWVLFEHGGSGVCVFSREELLNYRHEFNRV